MVLPVSSMQATSAGLLLQRQYMKTDLSVFHGVNAAPLRVSVNLFSCLHLGVTFKNVQDGRPECPQAWKTAPVGWFLRFNCWIYADQGPGNMVNFCIVAGQ